MYPLRIVEIHIVLNAETQLQQTDIIFDFDVFVFQRPPETENRQQKNTSGRVLK